MMQLKAVGRTLQGLSFLVAACAIQGQEGAKVFQSVCSTCHRDGSTVQAPLPEVLRRMPRQTILAALETGKMQGIGESLSAAERIAVANYLGTEGAEAIPRSAYCTSPGPARPNAPSWNGWGIDLTNTRFQSTKAAGLTAEEVPKLKLKWAFGYPGVTTSFGSPTVYGGRVFTGSADGTVYSLDAKTGCIRWIYKAMGGVRAALVISDDGKTAYFGDLEAYVHAVNASTGELLWKAHLDDHPLAVITGTPKLYEGRLYVPISGGEEEVTAGDPSYKCCTLRGSMVALDAKDGKQLWKTYTIPDPPKMLGKTSRGTEVWGPSGASPWSSPTMDVQRGLLYTGTGVNFEEPSTSNSDSILAFDMKSGGIVWSHQYLANDIFNLGCLTEKKENCPAKPGYNMDIGVSPILKRLSTGRRILVFGQKTGIVYGIDPDRKGEIIWQTRVSNGGLQGGLIWGSAADETTAYYAISDWNPAKAESGGGVVAVAIESGKILWSTPPPKPACLATKGCSQAQPGAVALIPGAVFATSMDGHLRAYDSQNGKIVWDFDTVRDFQTVNGVAAHGGSMSTIGPVVADGMVYCNSGYSRIPVMSGNVFLAFSVEGK
jgi:polyvinyl alcohol dehydrogenase (cytochrome)